jgi:hypothetical protein
MMTSRTDSEAFGYYYYGVIVIPITGNSKLLMVSGYSTDADLIVGSIFAEPGG